MNIDAYNSTLYIDTKRLLANVDGIAASLPEGTELIPVLKGNAYGMGLEKIAEILSKKERINYIAVSQIREAARLIDAGIATEIIAIGTVLPEKQIEYAVEHGVILPASRPGMVTEIGRAAEKTGVRGKINVKINTGLNRMGFAVGDELGALIDELKKNSENIELVSVYTHMKDVAGDCGERTERQLALFNEGVAQMENAGIPVRKKHVCASAAFEMHPELAMDAVRIGRRLILDNPVKPIGGIEEVASWRTVIADVRFRRRGESIGYNDDCVLEKDSKIALLGVGYGDGLQPELVRAHAPVLINGKRAPLMGTCMDMCFVDVSGIDCAVGDEVTLFGYDSKGNLLPGQEVAAFMNDEGCTLTLALTDRVKRVYI